MPLIPLQTARKQLAAYVADYFPDTRSAAIQLGVPLHHLEEFIQLGNKPSNALQRALGTKYLARTEYYLDLPSGQEFLPEPSPEDYIAEDELRKIIMGQSVDHPGGVAGYARDLGVSAPYIYAVRSTHRPISDTLAIALGYKRRSNSGLGRTEYKLISTPQEQTP